MSGGSSPATDQRRQEELLRQRQINKGIAQLNTIFGGGTGVTPVTTGHPGGKYYNKATTYKKGGTYYDISGNLVTGKTVKEMKQMAKRGELFWSGTTSPAFGEDWLNERKQAYINYALPQVSSQASQMWKNLAYTLANRGLLKSGAAGRLGSQLSTEIGLQKQGVASEAENQANAAKAELEQQRSALTSQLVAGVSPSITTQRALATAASARAPSTYAPLGNMFQTWANIYLANQAAQTGSTGSNTYSSSGALPAVSSGATYRIVK